MKAHGLPYARAIFSQPIMGRHRHPLLNKETGVYRYDELVVLRNTRMPAVLLEAGSIINRDEELKIDRVNASTSSAAVSRRPSSNSAIRDGPSSVHSDAAEKAALHTQWPGLFRRKSGTTRRINQLWRRRLAQLADNLSIPMEI